MKFADRISSKVSFADRILLLHSKLFAPNPVSKLRPAAAPFDLPHSMGHEASRTGWRIAPNVAKVSFADRILLLHSKLLAPNPVSKLRLAAAPFDLPHSMGYEASRTGWRIAPNPATNGFADRIWSQQFGRQAQNPVGKTNFGRVRSDSPPRT